MFCSIIGNIKETYGSRARFKLGEIKSRRTMVMESSEIVDVNANDTWQELVLMKNRVLAKVSFTRI